MIRASTTRRLTSRIRATLTELYDGLFPTADEARLIEVLGGTTLTLGMFRRHGRQMTMILSRGRLLRSERFRRAALNKDGSFANDILWGLEIMGPRYERDVIAMYENDERLKSEGWRLCRIKARMLYESPDLVRRQVQSFIYT